jgi:hypothetical protein
MEQLDNNTLRVEYPTYDGQLDFNQYLMTLSNEQAQRLYDDYLKKNRQVREERARLLPDDMDVTSDEAVRLINEFNVKHLGFTSDQITKMRQRAEVSVLDALSQ